MNWHNLSDKEFDSKIKAHFEGMNLPFAEESWVAMNSKIERHASTKQQGSTNNGWLLGIVLLLSGLFFWSLITAKGPHANNNLWSEPVALSSSPTQDQKNKSHDTSDNKGVATNVQDSKADTSDDLASTEEYQQSPNEVADDIKGQASVSSSQSQNENSSSNDDKWTDRKTEAPSSIANEGSVKEQGSTSRRVPNESGENSISDAGATNISVGITRNTKPLTTPNTSSTLSNSKLPNTSREYSRTNKTADSNEKSYATGNSESFGTRSGTLSLLSQKPAAITWMLSTATAETEIPTKSVNSPPVADPQLARWSIGFGYAPDLSLVGFSEITKPGTNVAFNLDYKLNPRWSIQTGATVAKKNYIADGEDYTPPRGFWNYGNIPDQADATCTVIDIPINVRYYFGSRNQWYAATGLSTYLMLRENYDYVYSGYDPDAIDSWNVRNDNQHFLGVYNLSLGYQKQIAQRWFMEVEPFIKAPVSGIGFGQVKLWSTGTFFSIRYQLTP